MKIDRSTLRTTIIVILALAILVAIPAVLLNQRPTTFEDGLATRFESYDQILEMLKKAQLNTPNRYLYGAMEKATTADATARAQATTDGATEHSTTNVQVEGVDEADIIKTDGSYLYLVANGRLLVYDVRNPAAPAKTFEQVFRTAEKPSEPMAMYLDEENERLILLVSAYEERIVAQTQVPGPAVDTKMASMFIPYGNSYVSVDIYDLSNPAVPVRQKSFDQEGSYLDSRRIDDALYLLTSKYTYGYAETDAATQIPQYRVGTTDTDWVKVPAKDISVYPAQFYDSFLVISAFNTVSGNAAPKFESMLGYGSTVYVSPKNIYVAAPRYIPADVKVSTTVVPEVIVKPTEVAPPDTKPATNVGGAILSPNMFPPMGDTFTDIFRFRIDNEDIVASGSGSVPGTLLNQFAMDEHKGYLRIATTKGEVWRTDQFTSTNNLYILDSSMKQVGAVEGLARTETIKSVRFIGDRAYMVTFRTTDPLFVIDVSKPTAPAVLGELKIPGFSEYLHPYGDNLLIGFGQDAVESGNRAYTLGLKVSMFDVANTASPKEVSTMYLGDRGSWTELLYNHKALLFDKESDVIGFPVTLSRVPDAVKAQPGAYGYQYYNGFVVLGYGDAGFYVRGFVSHVEGANPDKKFTTVAEAEAYMKSNNDKLWQETIYRGVTVGDTLYTFSNGLLRGTAITTFKTTGTAEVPGAEELYRTYDKPAVSR